MYLLEIPLATASILTLAIPIISIALTFVLILVRDKIQSPRVSSFIEKIMTSPTFGRQNVLSILFLSFLSILLFVVGNMIGVFYTVMGDVGQAVNQGGTGDSRIVLEIVFLDPYNAGWLGTLPWYGAYPYPLSGEIIYHDTWEWIFFTAMITDNPGFFNSILNEVILFSFGMSLFFLLPLLIPHVRRSFLPSLFLLISGMYVASTALLRCLAQVIALGFLGDTIRYGSYEQSIAGVDPTAVPTVISALSPYVLMLALLFSIVGYKLWRGYYPENRRSAVWFVIFLLGCYFLTFLIALW